MQAGTGTTSRTSWRLCLAKAFLDERRSCRSRPSASCWPPTRGDLPAATAWTLCPGGPAGLVPPRAIIVVPDAGNEDGSMIEVAEKSVLARAGLRQAVPAGRPEQRVPRRIAPGGGQARSAGRIFNARDPLSPRHLRATKEANVPQTRSPARTCSTSTTGSPVYPVDRVTGGDPRIADHRGFRRDDRPRLPVAEIRCPARRAALGAGLEEAVEVRDRRGTASASNASKSVGGGPGVTASLLPLLGT